MVEGQPHTCHLNAPGGNAASLGDALPAIAEELAAYLATRLEASLANMSA